jgi:hypothetical protein
VHQYGLEIEDGGIDPRILVEAISRLEDKAQGGVRDITRAIERQITDSIIDAKTQGAATIRLVAGEAAVRAEIVKARPPCADQRAAGEELAVSGVTR